MLFSFSSVLDRIAGINKSIDLESHFFKKEGSHNLQARRFIHNWSEQNGYLSKPWNRPKMNELRKRVSIKIRAIFAEHTLGR